MAAPLLDAIERHVNILLARSFIAALNGELEIELNESGAIEFRLDFNAAPNSHFN